MRILICLLLLMFSFYSSKAQFQIDSIASGKCLRQAAALKDKQTQRTKDYRKDLEEYKKGLFCSDCKDSKRYIEEVRRINFTEHINAVAGREAKPATKEMYEELYKKYKNDYDNLEEQYWDKRKECDAAVNNEITTEESFFNVAYNNATKTLSEIKRNSPINAANYENNYGARLRQILSQFQAESSKGSKASVTNLRQYKKNLDTVIDNMSSVATTKSNNNQNNSTTSNSDNKPITFSSQNNRTVEQSKTANDIIEKNLDVLNQQKQQIKNNYESQIQTLSSIYDVLQKGSARKHLEFLESRKAKQLEELQEKVSSGKYELVSCTICNKNGLVEHVSCKGKGIKTCSYCNGTGRGSNGSNCNFCIGGKGYLYCTSGCSGTGVMNCYNCRGTGLLAENIPENKSKPSQTLNEENTIQEQVSKTTTDYQTPIENPNLKPSASNKTSINPQDNEMINGKKVSDIKLWILEKVSSAQGGYRDVFYKNRKSQSRTTDMIIYEESGLAAIIYEQVATSTDSNSKSELKFKAAFLWENIKFVHVRKSAQIIDDSTRLANYPIGFFIEMYRPTLAKTYISTKHFNKEEGDQDYARPHKDEELDGIFIQFPDGTETTLLDRLTKAFNDIIAFYKKKKPKDDLY